MLLIAFGVGVAAFVIILVLLYFFGPKEDEGADD